MIRIRINRYIMECKYVSVWHFYSKLIELIDTLWNVNCFKLFLGVLSCLELIDTLWNVNYKT